MKESIIHIIKSKPRHYSILIKQNADMAAWVEDNTLVNIDHYPTRIYSAIHKESNVCKYGNIKHVGRITDGWVNCGRANICKCTKENIAENVKLTKSKYTELENSVINDKRKETMLKKFGVAFSTQRPSVKDIISKSKLPEETANLLNNKNWLYNEYITNQRSLSDIAESLSVYYGTVGDYCRNHGFTIRQRTNYSLQELEICRYIESLNIKYIHSDWSALKTKELDVYLPDYNFGIELNGLYWHSFNPFCNHTKKIENKYKHVEKTKLSNKHGIDLLQITDHEWKNKQDIIKSIIRHRVKLSNKIYARKLQIKVVDKEAEEEFLNKNHLQRYTISDLCLGLYNKEDLVMLMSFNKTKTIEMTRLCSASGVAVIGGAQKLFKYAKNHYKNNSIIAYCDLGKFSGNVYSKLGFIKQKILPPGYIWTDGVNIIDSKNRNEVSMFNNGYRRFWNCGQSKWVYNDQN